MLGNHNNELNARFHRNAVRETIHMFKTVCDEMNAMLELPCWSETEEKFYDELMAERNELISMLKHQGMFL